jgi:hypothetical protein
MVIGHRGGTTPLEAAAAASSAAAEAARRVPTVLNGTGGDVVNITKPPSVSLQDHEASHLVHPGPSVAS